MFQNPDRFTFASLNSARTATTLHLFLRHWIVVLSAAALALFGVVDANGQETPQLRIRGSSPTYMQPMLNIQANSPAGEEIEVTLPLGQVLHSQDSKYCDVATLGFAEPLRLQSGQTERVYAYCLQVAPGERSYPDEQAVYTLGEPAPPEVQAVLRRIQEAGPNAWESLPAQLAVWAAASANLEQEALQAHTGYNNLSVYWPEVAPFLQDLASPAQPIAQPTSSDPTPTLASQPTPASAEINGSAVETPAASASDSTQVEWLLVAILFVVGALVLLAFIGLLRGLRVPSDSHSPSDPTLDGSFAPNGSKEGWKAPEVYKPTPESGGGLRLPEPSSKAEGVGQGSRSQTRLVNSSRSQEMQARAPSSMNDMVVEPWSGETRNPVAQQQRSPTPPGGRTPGGVGAPSSNMWPDQRTERLDARGGVQTSEPDDENVIGLRVVDSAREEIEYVLPASGGLLSRAPTNFVCAPFPGVSDPHAMLRRDGNELYIRDLHSLNGTAINNESLTPGQDRALRHRDRITLGNTHLEYDQQGCSITVVETNKRHHLEPQANRWIISRSQLPFALVRGSSADDPAAYIDDKSVSIPHAKLEMRQGLLLRDLNSTNGTSVSDSGAMQPGESRTILDGAQITLGAITFEVSTLSFSKDELIGGRYQLVRQLAQGGMATVFEVIDKHHNIRRALKRPRPGQVNRTDEIGQDYRDAFKMELAVSQKLDHPNLIKVIEIGEDPKGGGYLVMELLHGYTVRQILNEKRLLPLALAAEIVCQVADGLSYLHEQKWVHCDITPNNILIDRDNGKAVVFDLGTVQEIGSTQIRRFGTPDYLPPDFTESVPTNPSFDVYNLGATFFEMLLGIRFQDDSQAKIATLMNVRESSATLARQLSRVPDQATRELLERALQPRDRKVTMADFISVLESVRSHSLSEELFKAVSIS